MEIIAAGYKVYAEMKKALPNPIDMIGKFKENHEIPNAVEKPESGGGGGGWFGSSE